ncbi:MAG: CHAT domain-containing protein, partial [bacterium]|nr:CHAT domain-containing protein [bacterium]
MNTFEVTIQRKTEGGWPVVVEYYRSGNFLPFRDEGLLQLELELLSKQTTPVAYGTVLGKGLFREEVRDAFAGARAESEDYLRVLLFVEADDLKSLHWERLCAPLGRGWDFLTLDQRLPFSLYLPSLTDRRFPPIGRQDLRALVLVVNPDGQDEWGLESFDDREAVSMVRKVLADIPCDVLATVADAVGPPTLDELCVRITTESYTILHIVCHGRYRPELGETILYLANADNQVDAIDGTQLLDRLGRLQGARGLPHFIFLAACQSASAEAEDALGGLGQRLVRELG